MSDTQSFHDDESIGNDELIYRRIPGRFINWEVSDSQGTPKIPSQGFQDQPEQEAREKYGLPGACMSVDLGSVLIEISTAPEVLLDGYAGDGLVVLEAGRMRSMTGPRGENWAQGLMRDSRSRPSHAVAFVLSGEKKTKGMQRRLSELATWVVVPMKPALGE